MFHGRAVSQTVNFTQSCCFAIHATAIIQNMYQLPIRHRTSLHYITSVTATSQVCTTSAVLLSVVLLTRIRSRPPTMT